MAGEGYSTSLCFPTLIFSSDTSSSDGRCIMTLSFCVLMAEMLWDVTLDPDVLIAEFLGGYYGPIAAPFVRLYMDTMHAAIDDTGYVQPTKAQLHAARGMNSTYHNNGIQTWLMRADGSVENVEVS